MGRPKILLPEVRLENDRKAKERWRLANKERANLASKLRKQLVRAEEKSQRVTTLPDN